MSSVTSSPEHKKLQCLCPEDRSKEMREGGARLPVSQEAGLRKTS